MDLCLGLKKYVNVVVNTQDSECSIVNVSVLGADSGTTE